MPSPVITGDNLNVCRWGYQLNEVWYGDKRNILHPLQLNEINLYLLASDVLGQRQGGARGMCIIWDPLGSKCQELLRSI